eukprot:Rhum_TRINITY_DN12517_c0_g1::Rhum_TRINITY_DN12517_c0_g1_i1::g.52524::m.52524/K10669/TRPT1, TPT1; 2'-phosphotransferase
MASLSSQDQVRCSKELSYVLRHGAAKDGYTLTPDGFVPVTELRAKGSRLVKQLRDEDFQYLVKTNAKQRFRIRSNDDGSLWIAANQGHSASLGLAEENFMEAITDPAQVPVALHGTYKKCLDDIKADGLSRMGRQHVHFATGLPKADGVMSGMRTSCEVVVYLDVEKCLAGGLKLYRSKNDVILCPGDKDGFVRPQFFKSIELCK